MPALLFPDEAPALSPHKRIARTLLVMWLSCGLITLGALPLVAVAGQTPIMEHEVKAAMLYKFLDYIEWPPTAFATLHSPFRIWVLGDQQIDNELRQITAERQVRNRTIKVFQVMDIAQIIDAHVVFVGHQAEHYLPALRELAKQGSFLIVTENDRGLITGSTINLRLISGRVGFDVSLPAAQQYHLKVSARLLSVASSVEQESR